MSEILPQKATVVRVNKEGHEACKYAKSKNNRIYKKTFCMTNKNKSDYSLHYAPFLFQVCNLLSVRLLPIQQSMVKVFTEALQDPVMIPDGWSLIFTGRKVTLQL